MNLSTTQFNNRNFSIDILKFICAVLVVFLHCDWQYKDLFLPFTRCAVPCFFMIFGYFMYNQERIGEVKLKRNILNVLRITTYATILYVVWTELLYMLSNRMLYIPTIKQIFNWVIFNECPFAHHLWYLYAYIYVLLVVWFCDKYNILRILFFITPFLLITDLLLGKYSMLILGIELPVIFVRNFLFVGLPYFCIGMLVKAKFRDSEISKIIVLIGLVLFTVTSYMERHLLTLLNAQSTREHYFSSTFLAVCLLLFAITSP